MQGGAMTILEWIGQAFEEAYYFVSSYEWVELPLLVVLIIIWGSLITVGLA